MDMKFGAIVVFLLRFYIHLLFATQISRALDTITPTQPIRDGETIVSASGTFELGFFSPGDPSRRYVGIWYKKVTTVTIAWVANRLAPVTDGMGVLRLTDQGKLILQNQTGGIVWCSNTSAPGYKAVAQLLDSGNLVVVRDGINGNFLWQSFDYPTDTLLAGMKLGKNRTSGFDRYLTSWRSIDDPYPGNFTYRIDANGFPELILRQGSDIKFSTGPWNGIRWSGAPNQVPNMYYHYDVVLTDEEAYYHFELLTSSVITRLYLSPGGNVQRFTWIADKKFWMLYHTRPTDNCDAYNLCGSHGTCTITDSPVCACLKGFVSNSPQEWGVTDWSNGCTRRNALECKTDIFVKYEGVKLPNTHYSWFNRSMNLQDCRNTCRKNCSCTAYSTLDIRDRGSGCLQWNGELVDIRNYPERGQEIYIRMSAAESGLLASGHNNQKMTIGLVFGSVAFMVVLCLCVYCLKKKMMKKTSPTGTAHRTPLGQNTAGKEDLELPLFDLDTISMATRNFSMDNKLGEGGFGSVYKGVLSDGQEIAVKKLSSSSRQGFAELKNEVIYIAKLQHRNLVKLVGCCNQEENLLIYEYVHNGSLDSFLFDSTRSKLLDWKNRFNIMTGIARGLIYLHHDSRLRIIHRDIKASNILLDKDMNPKISDFGLARGFIGNDTGENTNRVVGTYGYMSPEYAIDGAFSIKSDVFSYGVLVLEIASGKRNRGFYHPDHRLNLLGHAWKLFAKDGKPLELLDPDIEESYNASEVLRCIHVGLLCVQRCPEDRPSMSRVVIMLESETELPFPKEPGFFNERKSDNNSSSSQQQYSPNEITMMLISPR